MRTYVYKDTRATLQDIDYCRHHNIHYFISFDRVTSLMSFRKYLVYDLKKKKSTNTGRDDLGNVEYVDRRWCFPTRDRSRTFKLGTSAIYRWTYICYYSRGELLCISYT